MTTLYDYAGGRDAIVRLAEIHYGRCLTDPVLSQVFGTQGSATHAGHLADWLTEVFGGPKLYTERHGGHEALLRHHANRSIAEPQRARFVAVFLESCDAAGLPAEPRFRERLREYLEWGTAIALDVSQPGADVTSDDPVPVWDWGPAGPPPRA
ncbi:group II truncated hemoglobin [Conexibacter woesei]|uniref:Globin n=1 Tax=Conexibacter woesei (strain DSM 14684 / CCUG 47730 / CIP 108061 / JCM 11494 / NBRC 100937 / ID131577) TaxID=469383 RepID=D3F646_CONWI|nr:group II truncated hemoglobin [Conexibacter woesei]ADB48719.1 globin [Conexibacter woesei DSM 14684]